MCSGSHESVTLNPFAVGLIFTAPRNSLKNVKTRNYRIAGYFRGVYILRISRKHSQSSKIKILKCKINVEEAWFSISIREKHFREQELNWLFAKYKRLENNPLYGIYSIIGKVCVLVA